MIASEDIQNYFFLGIGGIGMSALARYFHHAGAHVCGYDRTPSPLTKELEAEGIWVTYEDDPSLLHSFTPSLLHSLSIILRIIPQNHTHQLSSGPGEGRGVLSYIPPGTIFLHP